MSVCKNELPHAGTLANEGNPATDSDRVKAPVVGAGSTDYGESQLYATAGEAGTVGVSHLAPAVLSATSDEASAEREKFRKLEIMLESLVGFILDKKNLHTELKNMAKSTSRAMKELVKVRSGISKPVQAMTASDRVDGSCQTSPIFRKGKITVPRSNVDRPSPPPNEKKRKKVRSDLTKERSRRKGEVADGQSSDKPPQQQQQEKAGENDNATESPWVEVVRRGRNQKPNPPQPQVTRRSRPRGGRTLPDAIIIRKKGDDTTYADLLKKIKSDPALVSVGGKVTKIRRTANEDLLLVLGGKEGDSTHKCGEALRVALAGVAEVTAKVPETDVEIRDIDEVTSASELGAAMLDQIEDLGSIDYDQIKMRRGFGGTQVARLRLPLEIARKVIKEGKIKVGWVICRIKKVEAHTRCYRCWLPGHLAAKCRSKVDRSKMCLKCGEDGHFAGGCDKQPYCVLCPQAVVDRRHVAGSNRCPAASKTSVPTE